MHEIRKILQLIAKEEDLFQSPDGLIFECIDKYETSND